MEALVGSGSMSIYGYMDQAPELNKCDVCEQQRWQLTRRCETADSAC